MIQSNFEIAALLCLAGWLFYRVVLKLKKKKINIGREILLTLFVLYFLVLIGITIFKSGNIAVFNTNKFSGSNILDIVNIIPIKDTIDSFINGYSPRAVLINVFGNIILFMPLGFLLPILYEKYNKLSRVMGIGILLTCSIEIVQLFTPNNITDIDDIIFNCLGTLGGFLCYRILENIIKKISKSALMDSIRVISAEKVAWKFSKVLVAGILISSIYYGFCVFEQSVSASLPDEAIATSLMGTNIGNIVATREFGKYKALLVDQNNKLDIRLINKIFDSRYTKANYGFGELDGSKAGYTVSVCPDNKGNKTGTGVTVLVYGKNTSATKVKVNFKGTEYLTDIKPNDVFLAEIPDFVQFDYKDIRNLYSGNNEDLVVTFLDSNDNIVSDIDYIKN